MQSLSKEEFFQRYDIDIRNGRLGGGAFGTVYKAWDNLKDEWKAIKIAEVKIINDKEFSLISEFEATKEIPIHKNIINYESVHKFHMPNGVFDYAVMQYYPNGNLKQLVKSNSLSQSQKIELINGLLKGLQVLHKHGIIHRDIKPSNILISERKGRYTPKIADFGLSKSIDQSELSAITNSFGGGTLEYSSPEQLLGKDLRFNTDLWAVAVIAYELFIGQIPFITGETQNSAEAKRRVIYQNIVNAPIPPEVDECPAPYDDMIKQCLIKDPDKRIKSAAALISFIERFKVKERQENTQDDTEVLPVEKEEEETIIITKERRSLPEEDTKQAIELDYMKVKEWLSSIKLWYSLTIVPFIKEYQKEILYTGILLLFPILVYKFLAIMNTGVRFYTSNNKFGIININQDTITEAIFDSYTPYEWGSATVAKNDSIFSVNKQGELWFRALIPTEEAFSSAKANNTIDSINSSFDEIQSLDSLLTLLSQNEKLKDNTQFSTKLKTLKDKADNNFWTDVLSINSLENYNNYLEKFPEGLHIEECKKRMDTLMSNQEMVSKDREETMYQNAIKTNQRYALSRYLESYPNGKYVVQVNKVLEKLENELENEAWQNTIKTNTILAVNDFLSRYPKSAYKEEATKLKETLLINQAKGAWDKIKGSDQTDDFIDYIAQYPNSPYGKQASEKINELKALNALNQALSSKEVEAFKDIILKYPNTFAAERAEKEVLALEKEDSKKTSADDTENLDLSVLAQKALESIPARMIKITSKPFKIGCTEDCEKDNVASRTVELNDFYISKYEVSQAEYLGIMRENPSGFKDCMTCPVENVSYSDAKRFIKKLNELTKENYRLPTEYEWEYAARANTNSKYAGGDDLIKVGVYRSNSNNGTQKNGSKAPNAFGLYDMSGNVHEWCDSQYSKNGYAIDAEYTNEIILRGGSWRSRSKSCRVDMRGKSSPSTKNSWVGFRLAKS